VIFKPLLDLFFPPTCIHCGEDTSLYYLCKECWLESKLLPLDGRCLHCFQEIDEPSGLCSRCRHAPLLPFPRAALFAKEAPISRLLNREESIKPLAGFCVYQWLKLEWKTPDLIASIPPHKKKVARRFAELLHIPSPHLFRVLSWPLYPRKWEVNEKLIDDDTTLLLIDDGCTFEELQMASRALSMAFPKKVYILSLTI